MSAGVWISNRVFDPSSDGQPTISVTSDVTVTGWLVDESIVLQYGGGENSTFAGGAFGECSFENCSFNVPYMAAVVGRRLIEGWSLVAMVCSCGTHRPPATTTGASKMLQKKCTL